LAAAAERDEILFERESFAVPPEIHRYFIQRGRASIWTKRKIPIEPRRFARGEVRFLAKDGVEVPMFLVGGRQAFTGPRPTILTSYGGFGTSVTPQFSVLAMYLMERGCLFALPRIRGGSDLGAPWHEAGRGRNRQVAFDDFLSAAEWLISSGHTDPNRLAIFGGSNSGLLVLAVMTQRPDLFRAVLAIAPLADMLRYHLFDQAHYWREEFGTSENQKDFEALRHYSPYHNVQNGTAYPATMIVSGDRDQNCNSLHARKMTARLQAANGSASPILLDYQQLRGHSPVLPLSFRVEALTDRLAFLVDQLGLEP
jgi:prolyl oligopeptidase